MTFSRSTCARLFAALLVLSAVSCRADVPEAAVTVEQPIAISAVADSDAPTPSPAPHTNIRQVDFGNGMRYSSNYVDGLVPPVVDAAYENGEFGDEDFYAFYVSEPVFVDLDGDDVEEAAVRTSWNGGGTGYFDELQVFRMIDGQIVPAADARSYGDRAFGGISTVVSAHGLVAVDVYIDGVGACCPTSLVREWVGLTGDELVTIERGQPVRVAQLRTATFEPAELAFLPGTSQAVLEVGPSDEQQVVRFDARAGQHIDVNVLAGPGFSGLQLTHVATGATRPFVQATVLDLDGMHELGVTVVMQEAELSQSARLLFSITSQPPSPSGDRSWHSQRYTATAAGDPAQINVDVAYPVFRNAPAANAAIAAWIGSEVDPWIAYALETVPPVEDSQGGGDFEMHYSVTMVSGELVSIEFQRYEYVCCRPYPNIGYRSLVVDLDDGRILDDTKILDLDRLDEIETLWFLALQADEQWLDAEEPPADHLGGSDTPAWSSLTLSPVGLTFGTDRIGARPPTSVTVSFAQLGSLVSPEIVQAASAGSSPGLLGLLSGN